LVAVGRTDLPYRDVSVKDGADVRLADDDMVYVDDRGRINAFVSGGQSYVLAAS
jgi:hypothetical protein